MLVNDLPPVEEAPAAHLEGRVLANGWKVVTRITKERGATGGNFSVSYTVEDDHGRRAFMKALNFASITEQGSLVDQLHAFTSAYIFERDLLAHCESRKMSRVIRLIDHGHVEIAEAGPLLSQVPYLIFEQADGDIRAFQARASESDSAWAFRVMKDVLQGVGQLHSAHAAHQDLKPSNVLTQDDGALMKLGDLGRADRRDKAGPSTNLRIPGAKTYAPPEQQYGSFRGEWEERKASDLYLAGSLGIQLFLGNCMSALIQYNLPAAFRVLSWNGSFEDVLPYLKSAHAKAIIALEQVVLARTGDEESAQRYAVAVGQMTNPAPAERGHPRDRAASTSSYSVERYVSLMDRLSKRAYYKALGVRSGG